MLQVTLGVNVPGSKNSICKDSDSIKLKFGIQLQCGSSVGWVTQGGLHASVAARIVEPVVLLGP